MPCMCGGCRDCMRSQGRDDDAGDEFPFDLEVELDDEEDDDGGDDE